MAWSKEGVVTVIGCCCVVNTISVLVYVFGSYRKIHRKGVYYDVAFGIETSLNLLSDFTMIGTLQNNADVLRMLSVFLIWNTGSTLFCYVGHIAASKFSSKYERIEKLDADIDEDSYRIASFIHDIIMYTVIALVKVVNTICVFVYVFGSYRRIHNKGAYYDVAFGVETSLNLISDFAMIGALENDAIPESKVIPTADMLETMSGFLMWNVVSTLFCYVGHIAASEFSSRYTSTLINGVIMHTVIAIIKSYVLYGIYTFYRECKRTGIVPTDMQGAMFVNSPGGGTAGGQEPVVIIIRQSSATAVDPGTGGRSLTPHKEVIQLSGSRAPLSGTSAALKKGAEVAQLPTEGKKGPSEEKPLKASSKETLFGSTRSQSHHSFQVPEAVFPALRPQDGAVPGPSKPRRGSLR
ncbi:uncharacterized protein [Dermacentor albipictus]|uniref:uncharacterized protein isoform X2 n=1 Tax=Dermacentor albipictus TaxID=60249 RepID=UPI0031FBE166